MSCRMSLLQGWTPRHGASSGTSSWMSSRQAAPSCSHPTGPRALGYTCSASRHLMHCGEGGGERGCLASGGRHMAKGTGVERAWVTLLLPPSTGGGGPGASGEGLGISAPCVPQPAAACWLPMPQVSRLRPALSPQHGGMRGALYPSGHHGEWAAEMSWQHPAPEEQVRAWGGPATCWEVPIANWQGDGMASTPSLQLPVQML